MKKELDRKNFLKKGLLGLGTVLSIPALLDACVQSTGTQAGTGTGSSGGVSPSETKGPFPIKTPAELVKANIVSDREGIALQINFKIESVKTGSGLSDVKVDLWYCDAAGNYSEYGGTGMQQIDFTNVHFLRGRQSTDANGNVSFISIYPGWYRGRAPHLHVEILDSNNKSLLVTQVAFPEDISSTVYTKSPYQGKADTSNAGDNVFYDSLAQNMADSVTGNNSDGYTLNKTIRVNV